MSRSPIRSLLIALLVFGLAAQGAGTATVASFSDQETAIGEITADTDFGTSAADQVSATGEGEYEEDETLKIELSNSGANDITIASFSVDTTIDGDPRERYGKISHGPPTGPPGPTIGKNEDAPFHTDGTQYDRTGTATDATICAGESPFLRIHWDANADYEESGLDVVSANNADIAVTLTFEDSSSKTIYVAPNDEEDGGLGHLDGGSNCP